MQMSTTMPQFTSDHTSPTEKEPAPAALKSRLQYVLDDGICYVLVNEQSLPASIAQSLPSTRWALDIGLMPKIRTGVYKDERAHEQALAEEIRLISEWLLPFVAENMTAANLGDMFLIRGELVSLGLCFIVRAMVQQVADGTPIRLVQLVIPPIPISDGRRLH